MVPQRPDINDAEKILAIYEAAWRGLAGVVSVKTAGVGDEKCHILITAMNAPAAEYVKTMTPRELKGVEIRVESPGFGALPPNKKKT